MLNRIDPTAPFSHPDAESARCLPAELSAAAYSRFVAAAQRVLVVGGSIAGLSTAIGLGRLGIQCDVIDLHGSPDGAAINMQPGACYAFKLLGVDECLKPLASTDEKTWYCIYSPTGEQLVTVDLPVPPHWEAIRMGIDRRIIVRELGAVARDELGATIRTGRRRRGGTDRRQLRAPSLRALQEGVGYANEMCRYEQQLLAGPPDPETFARLRADIQQAMGRALNVLGQQF